MTGVFHGGRFHQVLRHWTYHCMRQLWGKVSGFGVGDMDPWVKCQVTKKLHRRRMWGCEHWTDTDPLQIPHLSVTCLFSTPTVALSVMSPPVGYLEELDEHTHTHTHTHTQSLHTVMSEKLVGNFAISFWMQRAKKCVFPDSDSTWLQCNTISFHTNIGCLLCILSKWRKETRKAFAYTEYKMVWIQGNPVFKTCCSHFCEQWEHLFQLDPPSCFRPSK
jgi:hypothetical protein